MSLHPVHFRFLRIANVAHIFSQVSEELPFMSYLLQTVRKNNFQSKHQKLIFKPVMKNAEKELLHTSLIDSLQKCKSVEEQIKVFHSVVKLPDENISCRHSICKDLEKTLQPYFPYSVSVCLIGSSINDLGFRGCDVDLTLQFSTVKVNEHSARESLFSIEEGEKAKAPINEVCTAKHQLSTVRNILQNSGFQEPLTVIPGRCPILNFSFQNLPCDLSINNSSGLLSTNLMLFCGKLDERITPLMQIIIYWAKHSKLIGGPGKFKTYAIFLMVVYFLQTRNPPVLPSIETIFSKTDFLSNLDNWSYDVRKYLRQFKKSENTQTVEDLMREFFFFYGNYDFSHIICPVDGSSIHRKLFPEKFGCNNSFELNTVCIQDPVILTWNVTTGVSWKNCKNFMKAIILVWDKYQDKSCWIPGSHNWGLSSFINSKFTYDKLKNIQEFIIDLPFASNVIDSFMHKNLSVLFEQGANNVKHILNYCLNFKCYLFNDTNFSFLELPRNVRTVIEKQIHRSDINDCSTERSFVLSVDNFKDNQNSQLLTQFICADSDTWSGRNTYILLSGSTKDAFEYEHKISEKLELERENNEKEVFYFLCQCYCAYMENNVCLIVKFKPLSNYRFIPKLAIFLKEYIPKLMDKVSYELQEK